MQKRGGESLGAMFLSGAQKTTGLVSTWSTNSASVVLRGETRFMGLGAARQGDVEMEASGYSFQIASAFSAKQNQESEGGAIKGNVPRQVQL